MLAAKGNADTFLLACEYLCDPQFVLRAVKELRVAVKLAVQYEVV